MDPSKPTTETNSDAGALGSNLPPVAVPASDKLARQEASNVFEDSERHSLLVRQWAAIASLVLVILLYAMGLFLIAGSAWLGHTLCNAPHVEVAAMGDGKSASTPIKGAPVPAASSIAGVKGAGTANPMASEANAAEAVSPSCGNALALLNSHAMLAAFIALFSIPTVILIVLFRAFAAGKKESAVPDTAVSWIGERVVAFLEKFASGKD